MDVLEFIPRMTIFCKNASIERETFVMTDGLCERAKRNVTKSNFESPYMHLNDNALQN